MRVNEESNKNMSNIIRANLESYKTCKVNGLYINPFLFSLKPLSKIIQFIKKYD